MARDSWLKRLIWLRGSPAGGSGASYEKTVGPAPIISIADAKAKPAKSLIVGMEPVQDLHGYDSPWPAGGGKNKFDVDKMVNTSGISISNGVITVTGNSINSTKKLSELADLAVGDTYILTANTTGTENLIYLYGTGANVSWSFGTSKTITQEMLDALVFFYGGQNTTSQISNFMIRLSSVADDTYSPYSNICPISGWTGVTVNHSGADTSDPQTYPVVFPDSVGTVYCGTVDLVSGVLTVDRAMVDLGTLSWKNTTFAGVTGWYADAPSDIKPSINSQAFSALLSDFYAIRFNAIAQNYGAIALRDIGKLYANYSASPTGQLVYELATPQTYQLTPQQVQLLKGSNTLWSNADELTLTYLGTTPANLLGGMLGGGLGGGYTPPAEQDPEELTEPETTETDVPAEETPAEEGENNGE